MQTASACLHLLPPREALVCRGKRGATMTWTTVVMTLVLPMVIRGCEVTTLGTLLEEPLQKNGDSWTVSVGVKPNHEHDWQLGLLLTVKEEARTTFVMNVILNHESDFRVIRLHGHIGREEITGDDLPSMPRDLSFRIHVTVSRYELELELDNVKKIAPHGLKNLHEMRTSTLALRNTDAAEGFSVSHGCVEVNTRKTDKVLEYPVQSRFTENRTPVIAAASCGAAALVMAATWLIYCASRRLRGRPPVNAASRSDQHEGPRPVHAQGDVSLHASPQNTCANVATPAQGTAHATWAASGQTGVGSALCVDEHRSSLEEHIYESASDAEEQMNTDCANCQQKSSPEEHIYDSLSEMEEPMYTDCADNQQRCSPDEHIYESATDAEESSGSRSERNSIYGSERDSEAQQSFRNSIYDDHCT
ncbi:hypothetical protein C7M84_005910 [Penaeus vannamei]|uniref:Uncharacterized protein n=1 Tax=Penaeus vannamei TaxID=6689 RepID=A0A3R7QRI6_PENVA|nr:hypothetical protein C7M84_005910 [Penaeus vannamei]